MDYFDFCNTWLSLTERGREKERARERDRDRDIGRDRNRETETERQRETQADRPTDRQTDRQTNRSVAWLKTPTNAYNRDISERRNGALMGFPSCVDTILKWAKLKSHSCTSLQTQKLQKRTHEPVLNF